MFIDLHVLHKSSRNPGSQPPKQVPLVSWQLVLILQYPHTSLHSDPYVPSAHAMQSTSEQKGLYVWKWNFMFFTDKMMESEISKVTKKAAMILTE